jgi:hypothetical protein
MKKFLVLTVLLTFGFVTLIPEGAVAKEKELHKYNMLQSKNNHDLYAEVAPYLWLAGPDGNIKLGTNQVKVPLDIKVEDFLDDVDFTIGFNTSIKKGRWGYYGDVFYIFLDMDDQVVSGGSTTNANTKMHEWIFTNAATVYLYKTDRTWLELMAGIRTWHLDYEQDITGTNTTGTETWNEPFVGLRFQWEFSQRWYSDFVVNYGGFDIDGSEDAYELATNLGFRINKKTAVKLGYKLVSVDYDEDGFQFDNDQDGAFLGYYIFF